MRLNFSLNPLQYIHFVIKYDKVHKSKEGITAPFFLVCVCYWKY